MADPVPDFKFGSGMSRSLRVPTQVLRKRPHSYITPTASPAYLALFTFASKEKAYHGRAYRLAFLEELPRAVYSIANRASGKPPS
jgi:hypothetical protein